MVGWINLSKRTKKDTGWLKVINPFKKSGRSSSPRTRFYVSREDLDGEGSIEFEEEDEADAASSRSSEDRASVRGKDRMARAVSAEDLLDKEEEDEVDGRFLRGRVVGGFSKSMDELDAVGGFSLRSRSHDPLDPGLQSDDPQSLKENNPRLQQQSVSEPGPKSVERGRGVAKTLKKALPWIPRSSKFWVRGSLSHGWSPKTQFAFVYVLFELTNMRSMQLLERDE